MTTDEVIEGQLGGTVIKESVIEHVEACPKPETVADPRHEGDEYLVLKKGFEVRALPGPHEGTTNHTVEDVEQFVEFALALGNGTTTGHVIVGEDVLKAIPIPNAEKPDTVSLDMRLHPDLAAIARLANRGPGRERGSEAGGGHADARTIVQTFRKHGDGVQERDILLERFRVLEVVRQGNETAEMGDLGQLISATVGNNVDFSTTLPGGFMFNGSVFLNAPEIAGAFAFVVSLEGVVSPDSVFEIDCPTWDAEMRFHRGVLAAALRDRLDGWLVAGGTMRHGLRRFSER